MTTEAQPGSINKNFADFLRAEISEFNKLDSNAQQVK
jgi:hypothetical protein